MEYFSVINRKDSLTPAKTWMNHEDVMLSEVNQSQKTNTAQFYSYGVTRRVKTAETESRMICQRLGAGRIKSCLVNTDSLFCKMKEFWRLVVQQRTCLTPLNDTLKNGSRGTFYMYVITIKNKKGKSPGTINII